MAVILLQEIDSPLPLISGSRSFNENFISAPVALLNGKLLNGSTVWCFHYNEINAPWLHTHID